MLCLETLNQHVLLTDCHFLWSRYLLELFKQGIGLLMTMMIILDFHHRLAIPKGLDQVACLWNKTKNSCQQTRSQKITNILPIIPISYYWQADFWSSPLSKFRLLSMLQHSVLADVWKYGKFIYTPLSVIGARGGTRPYGAHEDSHSHYVTCCLPHALRTSLGHISS